MLLSDFNVESVHVMMLLFRLNEVRSCHDEQTAFTRPMAVTRPSAIQAAAVLTCRGHGHRAW